MSGEALAAPEGRSRLWHHPARAAALVFALGHAAAAASIGAFALVEERTVHGHGLPMALASGAGSALFWGAVMRGALAIRRLFAVPLLIALALGVTAPKLFVIALGDMESAYPSLAARWGTLVSILADILLLISFGPVSRLARRVQSSETDAGPLDVSAAACAWLSVVALLGVAIAPSDPLRVVSLLFLVTALLGLARVHRWANDGDDSAPRARRLVIAGLVRGALGAGLAAALLVGLRLREQRDTLHPGVRAVYRDHGVFDHCYVRKAAGGRDGVEVLKVDCGVGSGPTFGWDASRKALLEGDSLTTRLPELAPAKPR